MLKKTLLVSVTLLSCPFAQEFVYCAKPIAHNPAVYQIDGSFVNEKISQSTISIQWHHNPAVQDSFFITTPGFEKLLYITAGDYRFLRYMTSGAKRQIGPRHMRENIGNTPLKFDDLELLANGWFQCPDSTAVDPKILTTAYPETQAILALDTLPQPKEISVQRWNDDRSYSISEWKDIAGNLMPASINVIGKNFSGTVTFSAGQTSTAK